MSNDPSSRAAPARPDAAVIASSIEAHRASPEIDIRRHARNMQIEPATGLHDRRAIYLDLKFWIGLRNAEAAGHAAHPYGDILIALRQAVANGHVFCPISDSCFLEVFKNPTQPRAGRLQN
jgi:predicted ATPase